MTASDTPAQPEPLRPRRSCLAVPGSNPRFLDKAQGLRERIPDRGEMKHQATDLYGTVSDNPVLLAIGGLAIGALFASFIPVTNRERQLIEPAKSKMRESISQLGDQLESKLSGQSEDESGQEDRGKK